MTRADWGGPGLSSFDLVLILLLMAEYAVVAPLSVVCVVVGIVLRRRHVPVWLVPIAILDLLVAGTLLVGLGRESRHGWRHC